MSQPFVPYVTKSPMNSDAPLFVPYSNNQFSQYSQQFPLVGQTSHPQNFQISSPIGTQYSQRVTGTKPFYPPKTPRPAPFQKTPIQIIDPNEQERKKQEKEFREKQRYEKKKADEEKKRQKEELLEARRLHEAEEQLLKTKLKEDEARRLYEAEDTIDEKEKRVEQWEELVEEKDEWDNLDIFLEKEKQFTESRGIYEQKYLGFLLTHDSDPCFETYLNDKLYEYVTMNFTDEKERQEAYRTYFNNNLNKISVVIQGTWQEADNKTYFHMNYTKIIAWFTACVGGTTTTRMEEEMMLHIHASSPILNPGKTTYEKINLNHIRPGKCAITYFSDELPSQDFYVSGSLRDIKSYLSNIHEFCFYPSRRTAKWRLIDKNTIEIIYVKGKGDTRVFFDDIMLHCYTCRHCKDKFTLKHLKNNAPLSFYLPETFSCGQTIDEIFQYEIVTMTYQFS